jgi:phosphate:Na+ symporter
LLLGAVSTQPVLDVILAAGLTWAAHSSVAVVLLTMSFAAKGVVPPDAAFALVLGANLGTAINPVLEGGGGDDPAARRLPIGNLINRAIGVCVALAALPVVGPWLVAVDPDNARVVADFHTGFNLLLALIFFPLLGPYARLLRRLLPTRVNPSDPGRPLYLDPAAVEVPTVALGAATREALRMADALEAMLNGLREALQRPDRRQLSELKGLDDVLDTLNTALKAYMTSLPSEAMTESDHRRVMEILCFATNLEHAGDVVDKGLLGVVSKQIKRGLIFTSAEAEPMGRILDRLVSNLRTAAALLVTGDDRAARRLVEEKEVFRVLEAEATTTHFEHLREARVGSVETSALTLDLVRDLKRVNAHLVAAAAYPVLESKGELLPSRLR